ncbi:hypothetical protein XENTR_v10010545 [Xenopus tropicalis]|nr:hypothetical protein XENTR_v10010545 [Xenopus tropicalis]
MVLKVHYGAPGNSTVTASLIYTIKRTDNKDPLADLFDFSELKGRCQWQNIRRWGAFVTGLLLPWGADYNLVIVKVYYHGLLALHIPSVKQ